MEQLKPVIEAIKQNKFWIFCGVTLLACSLVYYMVSGGMTKKEKEFTGKITTAISTAKSLKTAGVEINPKDENAKEENAAPSEIRHPNQKTAEKMQEVVKLSAAATQTAWKKRYETQKHLQVFDKDVIDEPTVDFQKYLPAESVVFDETKESELLPETVRINYSLKIRNVLPDLADLIRAQWKPNYAKGELIPHEVIMWHKDNQEYWNDRFTQFASEWNIDENSRNIPYTLQVLYTTEDLWILRSVLKDVVGKTVFDKGDIYANDLAVIKRIDHILIGSLADNPGGTGRSSGGGSSMGSGGSPGAGGMMPSSGAPSSGGSKRKSTSIDPIEGRYVDADGKDIPAKDYRAIYASKSTDKKKIPWKIAKRVKIRIGLQMDSRVIPDLLANCANASFPIEVRTLRVNRHEPSKISGGGGGTSSAGAISSGRSGSSSAEDRMSGLASGSGSSMMPGAGSGASPGAGGGSGGKSGKQEMAIDEEGFTQPVEIYGYVYIYNPVDDGLFEILKEDEKKQTTP